MSVEASGGAEQDERVERRDTAEDEHRREAARGRDDHHIGHEHQPDGDRQARAPEVDAGVAERTREPDRFDPRLERQGQEPIGARRRDRQQQAGREHPARPSSPTGDSRAVVRVSSAGALSSNAPLCVAPSGALFTLIVCSLPDGRSAGVWLIVDITLGNLRSQCSRIESFRYPRLARLIAAVRSGVLNSAAAASAQERHGPHGLSRDSCRHLARADAAVPEHDRDLGRPGTPPATHGR